MGFRVLGFGFWVLGFGFRGTKNGPEVGESSLWDRDFLGLSGSAWQVVSVLLLLWASCNILMKYWNILKYTTKKLIYYNIPQYTIIYQYMLEYTIKNIYYNIYGNIP